MVAIFAKFCNPNPPVEELSVAMIEHNGTPIELMEFDKTFI